MKTNRHSEKRLHVPHCCQCLLSSSSAVAMLQQQRFWSLAAAWPFQPGWVTPSHQTEMTLNPGSAEPWSPPVFPFSPAYFLLPTCLCGGCAVPAGSERRSQCDWHVINGEVAGVSHYASTEWEHLRTNLAFTHRGRHTTPPRSSLFCCL